MKILNVEEIRKLDELTIKKKRISSLDLMEKASVQAALWILRRFSKRFKIKVLAGCGNNGGDGLAIARLLHGYGYKVEVLLVLGREGSHDFKQNLARIEECKISVIIESNNFFESSTNGNVIFVDAIFGSGLSRPIEADLAELIRKVNECEGIKIAIDIASGLFADMSTAEGEIFKADHTLCFQVPKLAFFAPENHPFVGEFHVLDIGLLSFADEKSALEISYLNHPSDLKGLDVLSPFAHKGNRGRATVIAGSHGAMGAAVIALKGALHSGVGLLSAQASRKTLAIVQNTVPEALIKEDENDFVLGSYLNYEDQNALLMGPAIGFAQKTKRLLEQILLHYEGQLILDADALTLLSQHSHLLEILPENCILTPHPREFKRLVGNYSNYFEGLKQLKHFAMHHKVVVVLKGKYTVVCNPEGELSINSTGNNGMAKGGSGDLLGGILLGVSLRVQNPFEAAKLAVYLHGRIGDLCKEEDGEEKMTPSLMIEKISLAFSEIRNIKNFKH